MTREDIVRLWDEANNWGITIQSGLAEELERFAALVAAAEREACAKMCEEKSMVKGGEVFAARIRARGEK
jgi:hypothetical protein